jgi:hypothetical protein
MRCRMNAPPRALVSGSWNRTTWTVMVIYYHLDSSYHNGQVLFPNSANYPMKLYLLFHKMSSNYLHKIAASTLDSRGKKQREFCMAGPL